MTATTSPAGGGTAGGAAGATSTDPPQPGGLATLRLWMGRRPLLTLVLQRLGLAVVTLFLVSVLVFVLANVLPGSAGAAILGRGATNQQVAELNHKLGLDRPVVSQYLHYMSGFLQGRWGASYTLSVPVRPLVFHRLLNSLYLAAFALVLIIPLSIGLGVMAAWKRERWPDKVITISGLSLLALPEFVSGAILLVIFAVELRWFPTQSQPPRASLVSIIHNLLLPALPLVFVLFGYISRMARAGTVEALESNYVRTAYLKGLRGTTVLWRHALRNSLTPTITVIAVQLGYLIGGLVVTESLFSYPGIGQLIYTAATDHDQPLLVAGVLLIAGIYTIANLLADLAYTALNPRLRAQ